MNKQEKLIVAVLFAALMATMLFQRKEQQRRAEYLQSIATNTVAAAVAPGLSPETTPSLAADTNTPPVEVESPAQEPVSTEPEATVALTNELCRVVLTSKGGAVRSTELLSYQRTLASEPGENVEFDFSAHPALSLEGIPGMGRNADYTLAASKGLHGAVLSVQRADGLRLERTFVFTNGYRLAVLDKFTNTSTSRIDVGATRIVVAPMRSDEDNDDTSIAVDARVEGGRKPVYPEFSKAKQLAGLFGAAGGGCSAVRLPVAAPTRAETTVPGTIAWAAVRTRFFVQVLAPGKAAAGIVVRARRQNGDAFLLEELEAAVGELAFAIEPGATVERTYDYYAGPRRMSSLRALGVGQVHLMRFGTFRIFCEWLLDILNFLHGIIPNYGVAIILLTCLVRLSLLPVTKRNAESMRRMQALQPELAQIKILHKDDPQKLQRETMRLYSEHKVNPLSSCLPMLIQLPVFVALFTVLRSSVELRFEPFLWVADLSGPENLFKETLGYGVNLLPVLMSGTMALQTYLTPQAGDASQHRMMMIIMPVMMLVMFYSFPAGLGLYWTTSQVLAIFGLLWVRRKNRAAGTRTADGVEVLMPPKETRQMRRSRDR